MNKPTDFIVLNPSPVNVRNGVATVVVFQDEKPGYITERTYMDAEARGLITIRSIGGNDLADAYGRTRISYTINKD